MPTGFVGKLLSNAIENLHIVSDDDDKDGNMSSVHRVLNWLFCGEKPDLCLLTKYQ